MTDNPVYVRTHDVVGKNVFFNVHRLYFLSSRGLFRAPQKSYIFVGESTRDPGESKFMKRYLVLGKLIL